MDSKRRLTVPIAVASAAPGDTFRSVFDAEEGEIIFRRIAPAADWLAVQAECPVPMHEVPRRRKELSKRRS